MRSFRTPWNTRSTPLEARRSIWWVLDLDPKKRGSLEQQILALAGRLRERGIALTLVTAARPAAWLERELRARRTELRVLDFRRPWASAFELAAWLRQARPRLVHFHFLRACSPVCVAAHLAGARAIVTDHVTPVRVQASLARRLAKRVRDRLLAPLVDRRVAVSPSVAAQVAAIEEVALERLAVIENGIDLDRFLGADGDGIRDELHAGSRALIACVSRLASEKGIESAIRMMTMLRSRALLALVGDGPEAARFRALTAELGLAADVRFLGLRDDVERIYAASDVVVVPSHWQEAFGLAVVEGMAAGKPVVVADSGAMPQLVGDAGLVVPRRDPGALAGAVSRLLDDPRLRARLGRAARERAIERFGMSRWLDDTLALYERIAA
jgi:glycosyltransferase involved in cell wall biosynthesis